MTKANGNFLSCNLNILIDASKEEQQQPQPQSQYKDALKNLLAGNNKQKYQDDEQNSDDEDEEMQTSDLINDPSDAPQEYEEQENQIEIHQGPYTVLSNNILSYERFYPGRILGNTFTITNKTSKSFNINLRFSNDGIDNEYVSGRLMDFYEVSKPEDIEQPYLRLSKGNFIDAQKEFE